MEQNDQEQALEQEGLLIEQLEEMGAPQDVIDEFRRSTINHNDEHQPEILDLDSLLHLDHIQEQNKDLIPD